MNKIFLIFSINMSSKEDHELHKRRENRSHSWLLSCPKCGKFVPTEESAKIRRAYPARFGKIVKSGSIKWEQRYKCKGCSCYFTRHSRPQKTISSHMYRQVLHLYIENIPLREIGKVCGVSNVTVYNWLKEIGAKELKLDRIRETRKWKVTSWLDITRLKSEIIRIIEPTENNIKTDWMFLKFWDRVGVIMKTR